MNYPKRIIVEKWNNNWEGWQRLFDCMYVMERARLGLEPDIFIPSCPICPHEAIMNTVRDTVEEVS